MMHFLKQDAEIVSAVHVLAKYYNTQYGISMEELADSLLVQMYEKYYYGHEDFFVKKFGGKPFEDGMLNQAVFEKWLCVCLFCRDSAFLAKKEAALSS